MKQYVRVLNQYYRYLKDDNTLVFDDGTVYTLQEAIILSKGKANDAEILAVHNVKQIFKGILEEFPFGLHCKNGEVRKDETIPLLSGVARKNTRQKKTNYNQDQLSLNL